MFQFLSLHSSYFHRIFYADIDEKNKNEISVPVSKDVRCLYILFNRNHKQAIL